MAMEVAPTSALTMTKADLLLEFLIVPFDPPQLGLIDEVGESVSSGKVESQYLVGSTSRCDHSMRNHSSGRGGARQ
ncbi:hypothetical protein NKJ50_31920 [Mesorhizobium sp. M0115]|uniref:hypothetical protein n=1 Tax=Mesorhizobium sp. M0115 TaxID=2956883 RepID=UPI00333C5446